MELLDAIVVPIHLYGLATAAAATRVNGSAIARTSMRLTIVGTSALVLQDDARVTTKSMYSPKAEAKLETRLEAHLPGEPGTLAARLINRVLSNFHVERDRFEHQGAPAPIVRLDPEGYERYLYSVGVKKAPG
jgi:hypothetical protein